GTNCDVDEYGFIWKAGSAPTMASYDGKKKTGENNQSTAYNDGLSIDVANNTGTTYYIKAYAHNSAGNNVSSTALQVTPQKVTFNSNGGSDVDAKYVNNGGTVSKPSDPTKSNYDFDDWYTDDGTFESSVDFSSTITDDVTYYANWTETLHDVTVEYKCGSTTVKASTTIENVGVVTTGSTTAPNDITGYTWSTWSAMPSGVTTSTTPLTTRTITINATADSKTITANYTANQYAITYKDEGDVAYSGNNSGSLPSTHTYGSATALVNGAKSGYDFLGWYTDDDCTIIAGASIGATAVTAAFTLYAKWAPSKYDVTLKKNGKTAAADQVVRVTYGSAMPDTIKAVGNTAITVPTQNGYTFKGYWDTSASTGGTQYYSYTGTPAALGSARNWDKTSDTNLFGRWEANQYTVTLDANEGTLGETTSVTATFDQDMPTIATANLPTREGYRFLGFWAGKTTGDKYYNDDGTSAKKQARWSADQKLYARWQALTYFSVNGDIVPGLTIDDGDEMPSADVPTDCGDCWAFLGWSEDSEESSAIDYASGDTHTFGTPTTLYAVFGQTEYKMITSTDGLVANDNYVIASSSGLALSNADHSYYSTDAASSDISSISRVNAGSISVYNPTSNIIWKFTGTYSSGQLYNTAASKYVNLDAAKVLDASSQNLTFSVNDDGETWTIKSSTPKYLHGYVDGNGDGFESLTSSYWDEDEDFSAYILHQTSSTVTTTPNCLTYDIVWKVGNDEASGTPTDNTTTCTGIEDLPDDPDDDALDCATKFMGWSENILTGEGKSAPADLFTTAGGAPKIDEDKTFHAVFASVDTESETPTNLTSEFTSSSWADENSLWTSGAAGGGYANSGVQIQGSTTAYATTKASYYKVDSVEVTYYTNKSSGQCGIKISVGSTKIDSLTAQYTTCDDGRTTARTLKFKSASLPLTGTVQIYAKGYTSSIYIASVKIYYRENAYKDYVTVCCDKSITIGTPSITGSGTVTFTLGGEDLDPGDDVETCTSAKDVVATVTPEAGYKCTSVSFTGVSVTIDPTPGSGNYPAAPSTQDYTLSFAKNTTSGTLSTSATFTAKALSSWTWTYNSAAIPNPVNLYEGEKARFDVEYTPSDIIDGKKTYTRTKEDAYMNWYGGGIQPTYFQCQGKASTGESTTPIVVTHADGPTITINVKVKPLPSVTFVDNVHNKTDFTNWGTDGVVSSTVTTGVVTHTKPTPSHADISDPGASYNACERQHLHLVGWIRSDWADEHPSATHSQITSVGDDDAGNPYFYTAGADIDVEAQNGKTFYAVWSKIE
ncbi:MAG: InlB B-repeat-containing protein, partial [Paludibacteraceae bacterium]|nr:InlB B-repeat-containing protein [Paludibacteraceae bacterium]